MFRLTLVLAWLFAVPAFAVTLDFDSGVHTCPGDPGGPICTHYIEQGVYVTEDPDIGSFNVVPGVIDFGYTTANLVHSFLSGARFDAVQVDLDEWSSYYTIGFAGEEARCGAICRDVQFVGYRDGQVVATAVTSSSQNGTYRFSSDFSNLDALKVALNFNMSSELRELLGYDLAQTLHYNEYHFRYDNLTLAPVPLPASAPLLLFGLVGLVALRRTSRRGL